MPRRFAQLDPPAEHFRQDPCPVTETEHLRSAKADRLAVQRVGGQRQFGDVGDVLGVNDVEPGIRVRLVDRLAGADGSGPVQCHRGESAGTQHGRGQGCGQDGPFHQKVVAGQRIVLGIGHGHRVRGQQHDSLHSGGDRGVQQFLDAGRLSVEEHAGDPRQRRSEPPRAPVIKIVKRYHREEFGSTTYLSPALLIESNKDYWAH